VGPRSVRDNIVLPARGATRRFGVRAAREERRLARQYVDALDVRPRDLNATVGTLSGGNQQKVALARARASDAQILLLEEPTQGIDVHAKSEIRRLIRGLAAEGRTVVVATSEFAELSELADVVHVMRLGELQASLAGPDATYETLLRHALP
jgi:ribose transport system ATP-binding protein